MKRWIAAFFGALFGFVFVPPAVIGFQDAFGYEVDPILGGIIPALLGVPICALIGYHILPKKNES